MRYHFFQNHFEKKVKIEKRKSPLYDRTLATDADCIDKFELIWPSLSLFRKVWAKFNQCKQV